MWAHENRPKYNRDHLRYPSDLQPVLKMYITPFMTAHVMNLIQHTIIATRGSGGGSCRKHLVPKPGPQGQSGNVVNVAT
jgi:hypothetical protein